MQVLWYYACHLSWLNMEPSSICLSVHLIDRESIVMKVWVMLVLADPPDRCWTRGHTHTHAVAHALWESRGMAEFTTPPHLSFSLSFAPTCSPASPLPSLLRSPLVPLCFVRTLKANTNQESSLVVHGMVLWIVTVGFHGFHQSVAQDKTRDLNVCLKTVGQMAWSPYSHNSLG